MTKFKLYFRLDDLAFTTLKEFEEIKNFNNYDEAEQFIEDLALTEYRKLSDVYIEELIKYKQISKEEARKVYEEESFRFIETSVDELDYEDVVDIEVKYEAGHSYTNLYGKTKIYCPNCGEQKVWIEHGEGDYYVGVDHYCGSCGASFHLPSLSTSENSSWQDKQVIAVIKNR